MKKTFGLPLLLLFLLNLSSCGSEKTSATAVANPAENAAKADLNGTTAYQVDAAQTVIGWTGKKLTGSHNGTIPVKQGTLYLKEGKVVAADIEFDMMGIKVLDIEDPEKNQDLVDHLRNDDFFSADKFPVGKLSINGSDGNKLKGNLSLKGITQPIEFEATITVNGESLTATAKPVIDRTRWDIKYKSGKFFPEIGDKAIYDDIELDVKLQAQLSK